MPKMKNIIIFSAIAVALILAYVFFFRSSPEEPGLVSSGPLGEIPGDLATTAAPQITQEFLSVLLNIQRIRLDDAIFSDPAFLALQDSSILLTPDGNEGRPNPFAPIGSDATASASSTTTPPGSSSSSSTTPPASTTPSTTPGTTPSATPPTYTPPTGAGAGLP